MKILAVFRILSRGIPVRYFEIDRRANILRISDLATHKKAENTPLLIA
jgi:hypothetical protein